jgi:hypothetical protein
MTFELGHGISCVLAAFQSLKKPPNKMCKGNMSVICVLNRVQFGRVGGWRTVACSNM